MRDTIVTMPGVPAQIAVEPVSHVQELLGDNHFK